MTGAILLQIVLIALNAVFASAEIAVISMNDAKLERLAKKGNKQAKRLVALTAQPARFLATIQVAITLAGFLGSAYAADNFAAPLVQKLLTAGVRIPQSTLNSICVFAITLVIAYFSIVFGELIPKRVAMNKTEQIALSVSAPLSLVSVLFKPLVWLLTASTNGILKLLGIRPEEDETVTEEEIRMMAAVGSEKGVIEADENEMIQNVLDFNDISVEELCTHRKEVVTLDMQDTLEIWEETARNSRHNYMPVCGKDTDDIIGVLDIRAFYRMDWRDADLTKERVLEQCLRKAYFVPENMKADVLCRQMKTSGVHFAVAIDEYGGMSGIVTMEDLLEEIVGNIYDEFDPKEEQDITPLSDGRYRVAGGVDLETLSEALDIELPLDEEYSTLGGLVFSHLTQIPADGARPVVECCGLRISVTEIADRRVEWAIVEKLPRETKTEEE